MDVRLRQQPLTLAVRLALTCTAVAAAMVVSTAPAVAIAPHVKFEYTGAEQQYTVPNGVTLLALSAQGGEGGSGGSRAHAAYTAAFLPVTAGQAFYVEVGGEGRYGSTEPTFGGGGPGGTPPPGNCFNKSTNEPCSGSLAGSGGGASDLRTISRKDAGSLASRVLVAAGSGGGGGGGISQQACSPGPGPGSGGFGEPLPEGNAASGPLPIKIAGGLVVPGLFSAGLGGGNPGDRTRQDVEGVLDAGPGTNLGGLPGEGSSCSEAHGAEETFTAFESVPGFEGAEGQGGGGGNAGGLPPSKTRNCFFFENACANAGAGGGGGGGYFGGGGGATGYNACTLTKQECNAATNGEGGAGGSSFFANEILYPYVDFALSGISKGLMTVVPVMEITSPASGTNYAPGSVVTASWECLSGTSFEGSPQMSGCKGTKEPGEAIDTSKGVHTFTLSARTRVNGEEKPLASTLTYTALEAPTVANVKPGSGPVGGGTSVTITGTNFEDVTGVSFGGQLASSFKAESATTIKAVAPASAAGKVDVRVTTGGGTSAISTSDHFKFMPTVTGVNPVEGPAAGGTHVTITGSGFVTTKGATTFKFGTSRAAEVECTSSTSCTATAPAHAAGTVDVKATVNKVSSPKNIGDHFTYL